MNRYRITLVDVADPAAPADIAATDFYMLPAPPPWTVPWPQPARRALLRLVGGLYVALSARNAGQGWRPEDVAVVAEDIGPISRLSDIVDPALKDAIRNARRNEG